MDSASNISLDNIETDYAYRDGVRILNSRTNAFSTITSHDNYENGISLESSAYNRLSYLQLYNNRNGMMMSIDSMSNFVDGGDLYSNQEYGLFINRASDRNNINNLKVFDN